MIASRKRVRVARRKLPTKSAAAEEQAPAKRKGLFASVNLLSAPSKKPTVEQGSAAAAAAPQTPASAAQDQQQQKKEFIASIKALNSGFYDWVCAQMNENPVSDWSDAMDDYKQHMKKLMTQFSAVTQQKTTQPQPDTDNKASIHRRVRFT